MRRALLVMLLLLAQLAAASGAAETLINMKAPEFTLQDQYDRTVTLRQFAGRVVVLLASDKEGSAQNSAWIKELNEKKSDDLLVLGVADLRDVPFFWRWKIRSDFKKDADRILLDWEGEVFTSYGLADKVPNIVLIDRSGMIRFLHGGPANPAAIRRLDQELENLGQRR